MQYQFYGWEHADVPAISENWNIMDPKDLYDLLSCLWCAETCAPRLREHWSAENKTLGQCSITAFLAQDIFGGKVFGIPRPGGNYHCYNVIGSCVFDLTSEQFGEEVLCYEGNPEQFRDVHFSKQEKQMRYCDLKQQLEAVLKKRKRYRVLEIHDADYGCEGVPEDAEPMCGILVEDAQGSRLWIQQADAFLTAHHIAVGSTLIY